MHKTLISDTINPTLISFKPRQVLLAQPKPKPKPMPSMKNKSDEASIPALKPDQKSILLRLIAGYLNSNGFSKTLKKFLSEAQIEKDDLSDSTLNLEDMYVKYLELCEDGSTNFSQQKVQDVLKNGNSKKVKEADFVAGVETVGKKKKKRSDGDNDAIVVQAEESGKLTDSKKIEQVILDDPVAELNKKSKEKKKSKKISNSLGQSEVEHVSADAVKKPADNVALDQQLQKSERKHKEKKKKKSKLDSEPLVDNVEPLAVEDKQGTKAKEVESVRDSQAIETTMVNTNNISLLENGVKSKSKRKKKDDSVSKSSCDVDLKELDERKSSRTDSEKDDSKTYEEDTILKESKCSKKRKRLDTEETNSQPIDQKEVEESKRRKMAMNDSVEPKTVKAFQRVKVDEVVFTDDRLKDNSYWAKGGADSGYGAKAQEVLGQVRGRDFRHEKTKKKRGSYRGGLIDLQSHSVKFSYSDEE